MDKKLFSERLQKLRIAAGYKTQKEFAAAYNKTFYPNFTYTYGSTDTDKGILGTLKNYENPNKDTMPKLETVDNFCKMLNCDIDYLLGYIDFPRHIQQVVHDKVGLSAEAVFRLVGNASPENAFIDFLLCSDGFYELDYTFTALQNHIKWFNSCVTSIHQCEAEANSLDRNSAEYKEMDDKWNALMESAKRWGAEQDVNIYRMGILFGSMLDQYKKERVADYGSHRKD